MKNNESKTVFGKGIVVDKAEQCIAFRGELDSLYAECVYVCSIAKNENQTVFQGATEILKVVRRLTRCEALCEGIEFCGVFGYSCDELREISHFPKKYLGTQHYFSDENTSFLMAVLNRLRTAIRKCERECAKTCPGETAYETSLKQCLNRLSSAAYILMLKLNLEENL